MKNTKRAAELLAELRTLAENDFERYRINVLEQDLTAPPKVEVIDDNYQKFNGVLYRKNNHGHYSTGQGIHQVVYRYYCGEIPTGYEIHHKDKNKSNNDIFNLQILTKAEHQKLHNQKGNVLVRKEEITTTCANCGKIFSTRRRGIIKFCCKKCSDEYHYNRLKKRTLEEHGITKICEFCGKKFETRFNYTQQRFCSKECSYKARRGPRVAHHKICAFCGKEFIVNECRKNQMYCSRDCFLKAVTKSKKLIANKDI